MNILMTGGTGLIGRRFIEHFRQYHFTVLTRSVASAVVSLPPSVDCIESLSELENLDDFDAVINLAGEPIIDKRWSQQQKTIISHSRWGITKQLVALFANSDNPPSVFLSGSAIGVYGDRGDEILTESSLVTRRDFPSDICLRWEEIAKQAEPYTRVVLLRTGIVLSHQGGALSKMLLPFKYCLGGKIAHGDQYMSWIHEIDYINALDFILNDEKLSSAINLVAPNAVTNSVFSQTLAQSLQRPAILPMPKTILQLLLGESSCLLLDSQRVVPQAILNSGFEFHYPRLPSALNAIVKKV